MAVRRLLGNTLTGCVVIVWNSGHSYGGGVVAVAATSRLQAYAVAIGVLANPQNLIIVRLRPHVEVLDDDVGARDGRRALDLDWASLHTIGGSAGPSAETDVCVGDTVTIDDIHGRPGRVKVQGVGVGVAHEVVESDILHGARAAVRLDHVHLVRVVSVHVVVLDVGDVCKGGQSRFPIAVGLGNCVLTYQRLWTASP